MLYEAISLFWFLFSTLDYVYFDWNMDLYCRLKESVPQLILNFERQPMWKSVGVRSINREAG